jgi:hypothetical protein
MSVWTSTKHAGSPASSSTVQSGVRSSNFASYTAFRPALAQRGAGGQFEDDRPEGLVEPHLARRGGGLRRGEVGQLLVEPRAPRGVLVRDGLVIRQLPPLGRLMPELGSVRRDEVGAEPAREGGAASTIILRLSARSRIGRAGFLGAHIGQLSSVQFDPENLVVLSRRRTRRRPFE